jgi:acetylornithine deacetylase/succinyl-diaminopimelate desuccinylase-like protein
VIALHFRLAFRRDAEVVQTVEDGLADGAGEPLKGGLGGDGADDDHGVARGGFGLLFGRLGEAGIDEALADEVEAYARDVLEPEMKAVAPEAGISFEARPAQAGLDTDPSEVVVVLAKALSGRNGHAKVAYGTEAGIFQKAGWSSVVCGPGDIAQAHQADEYLELTELAAGEAFMARLIADLAA